MPGSKYAIRLKRSVQGPSRSQRIPRFSVNRFVTFQSSLKYSAEYRCSPAVGDDDDREEPPAASPSRKEAHPDPPVGFAGHWLAVKPALKLKAPVPPLFSTKLWVCRINSPPMPKVCDPTILVTLPAMRAVSSAALIRELMPALPKKPAGSYPLIIGSGTTGKATSLCKDAGQPRDVRLYG